MKDTIIFMQFILQQDDTLRTNSGTRTTDWKPLP